jgi:KipI family sensor histidine kinase inhibitor
MEFNLIECGEDSILVVFGNKIDRDTNMICHQLAGLIQCTPQINILEAIPGYSTVLVRYDCLQNDPKMIKEKIVDLLERIKTTEPKHKEILQIPVKYGGEEGPDLEHVAQIHDLSADEVISIHCGTIYQVYLIGFTPGFTYLGEVDERIATPRLGTPRPLVAAGSVGIAGYQTGIYPSESPGGWQIIGRTTLRIFDVQRDPICLLTPGDLVKFIPSS